MRNFGYLQVFPIYPPRLYFLFLLAVSLPALQAQQPTVTLNGIVSDVQGGRLPGASVTLTRLATEESRQFVTDDEGRYFFGGLQPGDYGLRIELAGFTTYEVETLTLEAGRTRTLDVTLQLTAEVAVVTVTEAAGGIELTDSSVQGQIRAETLEELPLNGRNFLELAFLIPGNRPATNFDPTKTNTLEVSSAGQFGRGGNITVDGGDNNDEVVGGTLLNLPQDSIQEFNIQTNRFTAEVGRSGSSIINIVSKSGSNDLHGSAFFFFRHDALQSPAATFDRTQPEPPFDREQFGGSLGGPLVKDRLWWFTSLEFRNQDAAVEVGRRDPAAGRVIKSSAEAPLDDALVDGRVDFKATERDDMFFRYSFNRSEETANGSLARPLGTAANRQSSLNRFNAFLYNWTRQFSPTLVNSLIFHVNTFLNQIPAFGENVAATDPDLNLTNELRFPSLQDGATFRAPQRTRFDRFQVRNNAIWTVGNHTLSFGGEFQRQISDALFDLFGSGTVNLTEDFATMDRNGDGQINDLDIPIAASVISAAPVRPPFVPDMDNSYFAAYIQDDWRVLPNLTLNLGLRWEFDNDIFGTGSDFAPCPEPLSQAPQEPCVWLAGVLGLESRNDSLNNFGPRFGFAWDPLSDGKTVIRGGYGIFFDRVVLEVKLLERLLDGRNIALDVTGPSTLAADGTFLPDPDTGKVVNLLNPFGGAPAAIPLGLNVLDNDIDYPYVQQFSLGVERRFGQNWILSADGLHNFGTRFLAGRLLRDENNELVQVSDPLTGRSDNIVNIEPSAKTWYDGLLLSLRKRPTRHGNWGYGFNVNYTLSKTFSFANDDQIPFNVTQQVDLLLGERNFRLEKGFSPTDERHRLVIFGSFEFPLDFRISPIWTLTSDVPIDSFVPELNARLPLLPRNGLGRDVRTGAELNEVIQRWNNLTASGPPIGPVIAQVNPDLKFGDSFNSFDLRVTKAFPVGESRIEAMGEVFNLFNITNIRGFNNNNFSGFNPNVTSPNFGEPLRTAGGFFGSGGARAFQLSARFVF